MQIIVQNCNNIEHGEISVTEGALNIKYAINGTGKSTIATAISATANEDYETLRELIPFQHLGNPENPEPFITGLDRISKVMTFNEEYVNRYVYLPDELIKDSFEIFVKTPDYEAHLREIESLLNEINATFQTHPELDSLIQAFSQFIDGFGNAQSGYSKAGAIEKGFGKGNKIINIPPGLEKYAPYLKDTADFKNVKWIKWQLGGEIYLDVADQCPYCSGPITETKDTILKVATEFDAKEIEHLNKMMEVFDTLTPYFTIETATRVKEFTNNVNGMTEQQRSYLKEIKTQVVNLNKQLQALKQLGFHTLRNFKKIADELKNFMIDLPLYSHLNSDPLKEKIEVINKSLETVISKAGILQGQVAQQNDLIERMIKRHSTEINNFLKCAGYQYSVAIEESPDKTYRMILKHTVSDTIVSTVKNHLSFGERNAFALVLFMYSALKENPDLIILDDPISSFDGNKKFAILNMLFLAKESLKNRTVLLLTHEFNTVIDVIYTMPYNFSPNPTASFLSTKKGILSELPVLKSDIQSFMQIAEANINEKLDILNKLVYLRRLLEIEDPQGLAWQLISNALHGREFPQLSTNDGNKRKMTEEEITEATNVIRKRLPEFNYSTVYQKTQDADGLLTLYKTSVSNYEKLQIYRIVNTDNSGNIIIKKYVNETFHIENDYLFQLNPRKYDTVPHFIIEECDRDLGV
jgi:ABC-type multidrug transport system, ATPase and permease components